MTHADPDALARALYDTTRDGIVLLDAEGRLVDVNDGFRGMLGSSRERLIGLHLPDLLRPEDRPRALAALEAAASDVTVFELPVPRADGSLADVEWTARPPLQPGLRPCVARDVTDLRRAERLLGAGMALTRAVASASTLPDALDALLEPLGRAIGARYVAAWTHAPGSPAATLSCMASWSADPAGTQGMEAATRGRTLAVGESLVGAAWSDARPIVVSDLASEPRFLRAAEARAAGLAASLVVPVLHVSGAPLAVVEAYSDRALAIDDLLDVTLRAVGHDLGLFVQRQQAEEMALSRERDLLVVLDALPVLVSSVDAAGRYVFVNRRYESWFGKPRAEVAGRSVRDLVGEAAWERVSDHVARAQRGESVVFEEWLPYEHGRRYVHVDYIPRTVDGRPDGFYALVADMTERRAAEDELRRNRDILRDFLENATIGLVSLGPDGGVLWANDAALEQLGRPSDQVVGRPFADLLEEREVAADIVRELLAGRPVEGREVRVRTVTGGSRHAVVDGSVLRDAGEFVYARCFMRDVTDRKRAAEANARLAAIVASSNDAIVGKDLNGRIVSWNEAAERLFGYTAAEAIGMPVGTLAPEDRPDDVLRILNRVRAGERVEHFETERVRKDGKRLHVSLTVSPVRDEKGRIVGASKIARDITERRRTDEAIRRAHAELAAKAAELEIANAELQRYASLVSHDLKTPLRAIQRYAEFLSMDLGDALAPDVADHLHRLREAVLHAERLVDGLLELSRVGMQKVEPARVDLAALVRSVTSSLRLPEGAAVEVRGSGEVECDAALLRLAFQDLVLNGLKFNRSPQPRVDVEVAERDGSVVARVTDNGIGIEPRHREQVFGIFERLHRPEEFEGTGLGLAIVKKAVSRLGGTIAIEDAPSGQGTTFVVTLPCAA